MSKQLDRLETAAGKFNQNYAQTRADIIEQLEIDKQEDTHSPQADRALAMLDSLDAVLDELVTTVKSLAKPTKKSKK